MSSAISVTVGGVKGVAQVLDHTSGDLFNQYQSNIMILKQALQTDVGNLSASDITTIQNTIQNLTTLLVNGLMNSSTGRRSFLTEAMANNLSVLYQSLAAAGIQVSTNPATGVVTVNYGANTAEATANLNKWQALANVSLILQSLFSYSESISNKSFQSLVELEYVKQANDQLGSQLASLEQALQTTQGILNSLSNLQSLHNDIVVNNRGSFSSFFDVNATSTVAGVPISLDDFVARYRSAASAFYNTPISPEPSFFPLDSAFMATFNPINSNTYYSPILALLNKIQSNNFPEDRIYGFTSSFNNSVHLQLETGAGDFAVDGSFSGPNFSDFQDFLNNSTAFPTGSIVVPSDTSLYTPEFLALTGLKPITVRLTDAQDNELTTTRTIYYGYNTATHNFDISQLNNAINAVANFTQVEIAPGVTAVISTNISQAILNQYGFTRVPSSSTRIWVKQTAAGLTEDTRDVAQFVSLQKQLVVLRNTLSADIPILSGLTPRINSTAQNPQGVEDPNSLLAKIRTVLSDLNRTLVTPNGVRITSTTGVFSAASGFRNWLLDGSNLRTTAAQANQAGLIQQNITFAITAGQSLNDQQKESVRNYLFVFEEYYKSASAILTRITQIIERMAQNTAR